MNIVCAPGGIVDAKYPGQGIIDISKGGFDSFLLDMRLFCPAKELEEPEQLQKIEVDKNLISKKTEEILDAADKNALRTNVAYAPQLIRSTRHCDKKELLYMLAKETIRVAGSAGCRYVGVRPLFAGVEKGKEWEVNRNFYFRLAEQARDAGVMILLENQCKDVNGHLVRGICSDAREAAVWVDALNEKYPECFGFCLDVASCSLCGQDMNEVITALGSRIKAVILRECDGNIETSMLPFTCANYGQSRTDWLGLIRGLRSIGFDGELILDFKDTASAFSPLLRPQLMKLAKSVAAYFKWQIEIENLLKKYDKIVLFGAGNMCRNFMKCYGEKYSPLFTCDNNSARWGEKFCGLEVKSPECLKELSEDCGIFICNIYYREIEKQIRDMGIENNIEFFNDEYLSTFYMDRIER